LDDLIKHHNDFVQSVIEQSLLNEDNQIVYKTILQVFDVVFRYKMAIDVLNTTLLENYINSRKNIRNREMNEDTNEVFNEQENLYREQNIRFSEEAFNQIKTLFEEYKVQISELIKTLEVVGKGNFKNLAMKLDYNGYYSDMETRMMHNQYYNDDDNQFGDDGDEGDGGNNDNYGSGDYSRGHENNDYSRKYEDSFERGFNSQVNKKNQEEFNMGQDRNPDNSQSHHDHSFRQGLGADAIDNSDHLNYSNNNLGNEFPVNQENTNTEDNDLSANNTFNKNKYIVEDNHQNSYRESEENNREILEESKNNDMEIDDDMNNNVRIPKKKSKRGKIVENNDLNEQSFEQTQGKKQGNRKGKSKIIQNNDPIDYDEELQAMNFNQERFNQSSMSNQGGEVNEALSNNTISTISKITKNSKKSKIFHDNQN